MSVLRRPRGFPRRRHRPDDEDPLIFAGSASPRLTAAVCRELGVEVGAGEVIRFSEGTLFVRVLENVRGRSVYLVQSTVFPTNANFMELLFWIDAFSRASAVFVTVVVPYLSYAKGDKKDEPRVSIRARVCADAIEAAGADRVVTMDLHAAQIQGFFRIPVDDLYARPFLCDAIRTEGLADPVVVSPDAGFAKKARMFARRHPRRGGRAAGRQRRPVGGRRGNPRGLRRGVDAAPGHQPDPVADHHRHGRDPAGAVVPEGSGGLGGPTVRRGDPAHPPPPEHQRPVQRLTRPQPAGRTHPQIPQETQRDYAVVHEVSLGMSKQNAPVERSATREAETTHPTASPVWQRTGGDGVPHAPRRRSRRFQPPAGAFATPR